MKLDDAIGRLKALLRRNVDDSDDGIRSVLLAMEEAGIVRFEPPERTVWVNAIEVRNPANPKASILVGDGVALAGDEAACRKAGLKARIRLDEMIEMLGRAGYDVRPYVKYG